MEEEKSIRLMHGNPDSGMQQIFACGIQNLGKFARGIRNPGFWNLEYSSRNPESRKFWDPESNFHFSIFHYQSNIPIFQHKVHFPFYYALKAYHKNPRETKWISYSLLIQCYPLSGITFLCNTGQRDKVYAQKLYDLFR